MDACMYRFSSVQSHLFWSLIGSWTLKIPSLTHHSMWKAIPEPLLTTTCVRPSGHRSPPLGRVTSSCSDYLHADVSNGGDLSLHQQEVAGGQLVTMSLVPGTVDSDVALECVCVALFYCHLCCPSLLPTGKVWSLDGSWGLCASRLNWEKEKKKWRAVQFSSFPFQFSSGQSHLFLSPIRARTLKMPVPYSPPNVGVYTWTPLHQPLLFGRRGTDHLP